MTTFSAKSNVATLSTKSYHLRNINNKNEYFWRLVHQQVIILKAFSTKNNTFKRFFTKELTFECHFQQKIHFSSKKCIHLEKCIFFRWKNAFFSGKMHPKWVRTPSSNVFQWISFLISRSLHLSTSFSFRNVFSIDKKRLIVFISEIHN